MTSNELTAKLSKLFDDLLSGRVKPIIAVEANNAAGKIIANTKNQLFAAGMMGVEPNIPFLEDCISEVPSSLGRRTQAKSLKA